MTNTTIGPVSWCTRYLPIDLDHHHGANEHYTLSLLCVDQTLNLATIRPNEPTTSLDMPTGASLPRTSKLPSSKGDVNKREQKPSAGRDKRLADLRKDGKHRPVTEFGRQSTVVRRRLPWLDGPQQSRPGQIPGHFESQESLANDTVDTRPPVPDKDPLRSNPAPTRSLAKDPTLRTIGSTPSLRKRARSGDFKSLSLSSQTRLGIKPVASKQDAKRALGMVDEQNQDQDYASSEYSANVPSERESPPTRLPKNDPSAYERLVQRQSSTDPKLQEPFKVANYWLQSQLNLPLDHEVSPGQWPNDHRVHKHHDGHLHHHARDPDGPRRRKRSEAIYRDTKLTQPEQVATLRQRTISAPPQVSSNPPPPPPPTRKPTLFAMPTHLLPSSSSSSHDMVPPALNVQKPLPTLPIEPHGRAVPSPPAKVIPDTRRESRSLNRAVTGLENLMDEALNVAKQAAQNGRNEEVANILDNATMALRKASTVSMRMNTGRMSHPLVLSPSVSERDSDSDSVGRSSDASSTQSNHRSVETAPTLLTKSAQSSQQPLLDDQYKGGGRSSVPLRPKTSNGREISPDRQSMSTTPPRLYQPPSVDSIVRDFAYARAKTAKAEAVRQLSKSYGAASDYYGDTGQSVGAQPGVRPSLSAPMVGEKPLPPLPGSSKRPSIPAQEVVPPRGGRQSRPVRKVEPVPTLTIPPRTSSRSYEKLPVTEDRPRKHRPKHYRPHLSDYFESPYYHQEAKNDRDLKTPEVEMKHTLSSNTDSRYVPNIEKRASPSKQDMRYSGPTNLLQRNVSLRHPRRNHISLREGQGFSLGRYHRRQPIAREWSTSRKRISATIACLNTVFVGLIAGIYVSPQPTDP